MVLDERTRHELYQRLESTIGTEAADTLMAHLPPVGWADVATKTDLDHLRALTKADLVQFQAATKADLDSVRAEVAQFRSEMDLRFQAVEQQMDQRFEASDLKLEAMGSRIIGELRKEITDALVSQTKVFAYSLVGSIVATGSLVLAAVRLG